MSTEIRQRSAAAAAAQAAQGGTPPIIDANPWLAPPPTRPTSSVDAGQLVTAYLLWFIAPTLGLHHFYLGRDRHCVLHIISFGYFGLGWLRDGWRLPSYLRAAIASPAWLAHQQSERALHPTPPFWLSARLLACLAFGGHFSLLLRCLWPPVDESPLPPLMDAWLIAGLGVLGTALGVHLVGTIAPYEGRFLPTLLGCAAGTALAAAARQQVRQQGQPEGLAWLPLVGAIAGLRYRYAPLQPHGGGGGGGDSSGGGGDAGGGGGVVRRALRIALCVGAVWGGACVGVYHHGVTTVDTPHGPQTWRVKDGVHNVLRSPVWSEGWAFFQTLLDEEEVREAREEYDWRRAWRKAAASMDLTGERHARSVLGVDDDDAEWSTIKQAFRAKALEHHPDKHAGASETERGAAAARFRECQEAFDTLKELHRKEGGG